MLGSIIFLPPVYSITNSEYSTIFIKQVGEPSSSVNGKPQKSVNT